MASLRPKIGEMNSVVDNKMFRENVDSWIKDLRSKMADFDDLPNIVSENIDNTQHNYELIYELKQEVEELKHELHMMRLVQTMMLKKEVEKMQ